MKEKKKINWSKYIVLFIRISLITSLLINTALILHSILQDSVITKAEVFIELEKSLELMFWTFITLILTFIPGYYIKNNRIGIPEILELVIILFVYAGIFISVRFDMYYRFFWWDDLLHSLAGIIIGFASFILMYKMTIHYKLVINPAFIAFFAFTIAVTAGVFWEILEFVSDSLWATAHQKWNLPDTEILMGKPYQGSGLRDTMSDLILNTLGAFFTSVVCYFLYKSESRYFLKEKSKRKNTIQR